MFILYGEMNLRRKLGWVAEACPHCDAPTPHVAKRVRRWSHIYYIPVIPGRELGFELRCDECKKSRYFPLGTHIQAAPVRPATLDELISLSSVVIGEAPPPELPPAPMSARIAVYFAIAGLISPFVGLVFGLTGVGLGLRSLKLERTTPTAGGRGWAKTAIVLGCIAMVLWIGAIGLSIWSNSASQRRFAPMRQRPAATSAPASSPSQPTQDQPSEATPASADDSSPAAPR